MPEVPQETKPQPKAKSALAGRGLGWALLLPVVILAAIGIWFWTNRGSDAAAQAEAGTSVKSTLHLDTFVLNLADSDQRSYMRVGIDLGLNEEPKRGEEAPVAKTRDTILAVLAQAKLDDLMTVAGKEKLKENLLRALQQRVPQLHVEEVYFTEFLIQR